MGKYDHILEKLNQLDIKVRKVADIRPDSARIIEELLHIIEERSPSTPSQEMHLSPIQQRIYDTIKQEEQIRFKELATSLNMKQNHLWNELNILQKAGIVKKLTFSRKRVHYVIS